MDDSSAHYYTWGANIHWTSDLSPTIGYHYRLESLPSDKLEAFEVLGPRWLTSGHSKGVQATKSIVLVSRAIFSLLYGARGSSNLAS